MYKTGNKRKSVSKPLRFALALSVITATLLLTAIPWATRSLATPSPVQTKYLLFQIFTFAQGENDKEHAFPPVGELRSSVQDIARRIGTTGNGRQKLGFCVGPLALSQSDDEVRQLIRESFDIARMTNTAVAFHIDDQMFWGSHPILQAHKSEVLEWIDWKRTPSSSRRLEWGPTATRVAPPLCLNNPLVVDAVKKRAVVIGAEIKRELSALKAAGKEELFAGVIEGWESRIGNDSNSGKIVGYHSLTNNGFSSKNSRAQQEAELTRILKQFIELWAMSLEQAGAPADKMYSHIAFTGQGLDDDSKDAKTRISFAERFGFAVPDVAFSKYYRPGFSTYPLDETTIEQIRAEVVKRGGGNWISAEGTNVNPNQLGGEADMETYLAKMFNHGAVMVNIFSWGIGGDANKNNFFRRATESTEAIASYRKFLSGHPLKESARSAAQFSPTVFRSKIQKIQASVPPWVQRTRRPDLMKPMMEKLDALIKSNNFSEANTQADAILKLLNTTP